MLSLPVLFVHPALGFHRSGESFEARFLNIRCVIHNVQVVYAHVVVSRIVPSAMRHINFGTDDSCRDAWPIVAIERFVRLPSGDANQNGEEECTDAGKGHLMEALSLELRRMFRSLFLIIDEEPSQVNLRCSTGLRAIASILLSGARPLLHQYDG